jgi:hypothetical protein
MLYALGRDAEIATFSKVSEKSKVPTPAVYWVAGAVVVFTVFWKLAFGAVAFDVFVGSGYGYDLFFDCDAGCVCGSFGFFGFGPGFG